MKYGKNLTLEQALALPPEEYQRWRQTDEARELLGSLDSQGTVEWLDEGGPNGGAAPAEEAAPEGSGQDPFAEAPGAWGVPDVEEIEEPVAETKATAIATDATEGATAPDVPPREAAASRTDPQGDEPAAGEPEARGTGRAAEPARDATDGVAAGDARPDGQARPPEAGVTSAEAVVASRAGARRSCRLALRGLRTHVACVAIAGLAMAGRLAVASIPYLDSGFASPLSSASALLASMTWALPLLGVVAVPTALLAVAAAGTSPATARACALMAWAVDAVVVAALLALTALSAMASGVVTTCALGVALVAWAFMAVTDSLCARAARDEA